MSNDKAALFPEMTESFHDFLDRIWGEDYTEWASVFPARTVPDWQHMTEAMKSSWRHQANAIRDEVAQ